MSTGRVIGLLGLLLLLAGCESDADQLQRLESKGAMARLQLIGIEREIEAIQDSTGVSSSDCRSTYDGIPHLLPAACARLEELSRDQHAARTRRTLAERELGRFMR